MPLSECGAILRQPMFTKNVNNQQLNPPAATGPHLYQHQAGADATTSMVHGLDGKPVSPCCKGQPPCARGHTCKKARDKDESTPKQK